MAIDTGYFHSLALKNDGTVWAWGGNDYGQLGDGTGGPGIESLTPVQVLNLSGVTAMDGGTGHSLAVKSDGTVWAWGDNSNGQLGDGTTFERLTPVQVQNLSGVTAIAAGGGHSLALKSDGTVWAWDWNYDGEIGDGTGGPGAADRHTPVQVLNLSGVTAIATYNSHNLALKGDGTVWARGRNYDGEIGDGTSGLGADRYTPVQVQNLSGVTAIAAGLSDSLAVGPPPTQLTVNKILVHPDHHHLRLFNLQVDGVTVRVNINSGSSGPLTMSPGNHTVGEIGGTGTFLALLP